MSDKNLMKRGRQMAGAETYAEVYFTPETVIFEADNDETEWIEADGCYNLYDMV